MSKPHRMGAARPLRAASRDGPAGALSPLDHRPAFLVRLAQPRAFEEFHRYFAGLGVTPARFPVFALVAASPGVRPGVIAEALRIEASNVAALVDSPVAYGLAQRTPDASELRADSLHATEAGAEMWREMERGAGATDAGFLDGLTPAEGVQLVALLRKLLHR